MGRKKRRNVTALAPAHHTHAIGVRDAERHNLAGYVQRLEEAAEAMGDDGLLEAASGDDIAAELERFLRDHGRTDD